jgi:hypothetical protein
MTTEYRVYVQDDLDNNEYAAPKRTFTNKNEAHFYAKKLSAWQDAMVYEINVEKFDIVKGKGIIDKTFYANKNVKRSKPLSSDGVRKYDITSGYKVSGGFVGNAVKLIALFLCAAVLYNTGAIDALVSQAWQHDISNYSKAGADAAINKINDVDIPSAVSAAQSSSVINPDVGGAYWVGKGGNQISLKNNNTAHNPTYNELTAFILADPTNGASLNNNNDADIAERLHNNAERDGIRAGWVAVSFNDKTSRVCNVFQTTDSGLIYVDCINVDTTVELVNGGDYQRNILDGNTYETLGEVNNYVTFW